MNLIILSSQMNATNFDAVRYVGSRELRDWV